MKILLQCIGEAIVANGVKGLAELVPGGSFLYSVAGDAIKKYRERRKEEQAAEELRQMAVASFEEAKAAAERVVREVAAKVAPEEQKALEVYLAQVPGAVRRSLRRADDPSGKTVPPGLTLNKPEDLLARLPSQMPKFRPGDKVPGGGGWTLREPLGAGGFGEVWKAGHEVVPDLRTVKFCTDPEARHRLLTHEGKLVARVMREGKHPNVVGLVDAHLEGDAPWLAYEFVGGGDLTGIGLAWQKLAPEERIKQVGRALKQLASAAGHFHKLSPPLVHRDLKPANILFDRTTKKLRITDFGIGGLAAKQMNAETQAKKGTTQRTVAMLAGSFTPLYASPQQQTGAAPDPRDDVHALGVIAFQLLTGRFDQAPGPRYERDLKAVGVPDDFVRLIGDCVDPDATQRPANGSELAGRLNDTLAPAVALVVEEAEPAASWAPPPVRTQPRREAASPVTYRPPPPPETNRHTAPRTDFEFDDHHEDEARRPARSWMPMVFIGGGIALALLLVMVVVVVMFSRGKGSTYEYKKMRLDPPESIPPKRDVPVPPDLDKAKAGGQDAPRDENQEKLKRGLALLYGKGQKQDAKAAYKLIREAADNGNARAMYHVAEVYDEGYEGVVVNDREKLVWLERAAKAGDPYGQTELALMLFQGSYTPKSKAQAEKWVFQALPKLMTSAEQGDARAQVMMGALTEEGLGVTKNESAHIEWKRKSAEQGDVYGLITYGRVLCFEANENKRDPSKGLGYIRKADALGSASAGYLIAECYANGRGVAKDEAEAVRRFRKLVIDGCVPAMTSLADAVEAGRGVARDPKEALRLYNKAAERGYAEAMNQVGVCHARGIGTDKDPAKAIEWYEKAAEMGHAAALFNLAFAYEVGRGVTKEPARAAQYYRRSAEEENVQAMYRLARCYLDGIGVTKDARQAVPWLRKAADAGIFSAAHELAGCYLNGTGVVKNEAEAVKWLRKGAEGGHHASMNDLGVCLIQGRGVTRNERDAVKWFQKGADAGDADCTFHLGHCHQNALGVQKNVPEALRLFRKAADAGLPTAMARLGECEENGVSGFKNLRLALEWYHKAAEKGDDSAAYNLAQRYEKGNGVQRNIPEAIKWYRVAAKANGAYTADAGLAIIRLAK